MQNQTDFVPRYIIKKSNEDKSNYSTSIDYWIYTRSCLARQFSQGIISKIVISCPSYILNEKEKKTKSTKASVESD